MYRRLYSGAMLVAALSCQLASAEDPADSVNAREPRPEFAMRRIGARSFRPGGQIVGIGFSPHGESVIVGARNRTIVGWASSTGAETMRITTPYRIERFALSPDGKHAAVVTERDRTLPANVAAERHVWDLERREIIARLPHTDYLGALAFSPDGSLLATSDRGSVRIWESPEGTLRHTLVHPGAREKNFSPKALAFSPDGRMIASLCPGEIRVWNVGDGAEQCSADLPVALFGLAFTRDSKELIVGDERAVRFMDPQTGGWTSTMELNLELSGRTLAVSSESNLIVGPEHVVVNLKTGVQLAQLPLQGGEFAFSPDGKTLATGGNQRVQLWRMPNGRNITPIPSDEDYGPITAMAVSPDGEFAATVTDVKHAPILRLVEIATGDLKAERRQVIPRRATYDPGRGTPYLTFTPDGETVITASTGAGWHLNFWDSPALHDHVRRPGHEYSVHCIAISPDGRTLISAGGKPNIRAWRLPGCEPLYQIEDCPTTCLAFSPKGDFFVSGGAVYDDDPLGAGKGVIRLWDAEKGEMHREIFGHEGAVTAVAVSRNGDRVASICRSPDPFRRDFEPLRIWRCEDGRLLHPIGALRARVNCIAFSPTRDMLASGGTDGVVSLWSAHTGALLEKLAGHRGEVLSLAFTRDGRRLISGSADCTMVVWDVTAWLDK